MKKYLLLFFLLIFIFACTPVPAPTVIPTLTPKVAPVPAPIIGTIFWDANGSGLMDETSFIVPAYDPAEPPFFFELLGADDTDTSAFVEGELATVPEPPIPGIGVCLGDICAETGSDGAFSLQPEKVQSTYQLTFNDPNKGDPEKAFRYINKWNGPAVIESYKINGIIVPEQHLNDTVLFEIDKTYSINNTYNELGFMQGFLSLPYLQNNWETYSISNFVDLNTKLGSVRNYQDNTRRLNDPNPKGTGTVDQHPGIDFNGDRGDFVVSSSQGAVGYVGNGNIGVWYPMQLQTNTGHLDDMLVKTGQPSYRGMILGTNGSTGTWLVHIHFALYDLSKKVNNQPVAIDPFFDTTRSEVSIVEFEGSPHGGMNIKLGSIGYWTVVNIPQFSLVEISE